MACLEGYGDCGGREGVRLGHDGFVWELLVVCFAQVLLVFHGWYIVESIGVFVYGYSDRPAMYV